VRQVGIVGLGLIGGSAGMALRRLAGEVRVIGLCRSEDDARVAERMGAVDSASTRFESLRGCQLVLLATPIPEITKIFEAIGRTLSEEVLITDVASVKLPIMESARRRLPTPGRFLGGHPMAGKTESGIGHSDAALFNGTPWVFTPLPEQDLAPFRWWMELVTRIGARPLVMDAAEHDRRAAYVSHLAFTLSSAYLTASRQQAGEAMAGPGFRGMTRLAGGDARMYADIAAANRDNLLEAIDVFTNVLAGYRRAIAAGNQLLPLFSEAHHAAG
jgi:prephenate dehydrogenase